MSSNQGLNDLLHTTFKSSFKIAVVDSSFKIDNKYFSHEYKFYPPWPPCTKMIGGFQSLIQSTTLKLKTCYGIN